MNLAKTSVWVSLSALVKVFMGFMAAKILAIYVGPDGFATVGQFQNFVSMVLIFSGNILGVGVIKYIAEYKHSDSEKEKIAGTAILISVLSSSLLFLALLSLSDHLSVWLLKSIQYSWLFKFLGASIIIYVMNSLLISILNGEGNINLMTVLNVSSSLLGAFLTYCFSKYFGLYGALLTQVVAQYGVFALGMSLARKIPWLKWKSVWCGIDYKYLIRLLEYAVVSLVSSSMYLAVQMMLREYIGSSLSWKDAGYWQAVTRVSDGYLYVITSTLSVYYLPKLSSISSNIKIKSELKKGYLSVLPIAALMAFFVYIFRDKIILLLFTSDFVPMEKLFLFQLLGDVLKIGSSLAMYSLLSRAMTGLFAIIEIAFGVTYFLLSVVLINRYGLQGASTAFFVSYALYFLAVNFVVSKKAGHVH